jgi:translation initiation factor IF-2
MLKIKKEKTEAKKKTSVKAKKITHKVTKPKPTKKTASVIAHRKKEIAPIKVKKAIKISVSEKIQPPRIAPSPVIAKEEKILPVKAAVKEAPAVEKAIPSLKKEAPIHVKKEAPAVKKEIPEVKREAPPVKKEIPEAKVIPVIALKELELDFPITLKDLAVKLQEKPSLLIKGLMDMKMMVGINQALDEKTAGGICEKLGFKIKKAPDKEEAVLSIHQQLDSPKDLKPRSPIVTFMGHVDHGKTSLLDAIRKTKVADSEHGGITQHIGAYRVTLANGEISFLDTPGHEAFTAMRARGASITDIAVIVVAADDGVMPQTQEAIDHARAAGVSIIVAINKVDKPQANIERVKKQLAELNLNPEDWGGKTITVPVSAKTGQGIDDLLEMILLEAQMLELKANPNRLAKGIVIEAKMSKSRGPVSTLLIQNGTLHLNDNIIVGTYYGKIRAMFNDHGYSVTEAGPSFPVEVLGISGIPQAGEPFFALNDERTVKELSLRRQEQDRQEQMKAVRRISLEDLHAQIQAGKLKELKIIIKADVRGSLEAIKDTLNKLKIEEIKLDIIHDGVGNINSSDVILAVASNALILGFNVVADDLAKELAAKEGVDVRTYNIIYELANDIKAALEGMLEPKLKKNFLGRADVRKVFKLSRAGTVAGCFVTKGKFTRTASITLLRNGEIIFEGKLSSLKRFKDDVREVAEGFECGMSLGGYDNLQEGDIIEAFEIEKIARKL